MQEQEKLQILNILTNLEEAKKYIPYFSDLLQHPIFGAVISSLDEEKKQEVMQLCEVFLLDRLSQIKKTKGGLLFNRFFESQPELFWKFRKMNDPLINDSDFQSV